MLLASLSPTARAADTAWTGASSAAWGSAGNWSAGVPTAGDNAQLVSGASNTTIELSGATVANQLQVWDGAAYTLSSTSSATLTLSDQLYLFSDPAASSLTLSGPLTVSTPNGSIGTGFGDVGGILFVGPSASLSVANTFNVGYDGTGNQLQVLGGAASAGDLVVGTLATANTNGVLVNGGSLTVTNRLVVGASGSVGLLSGTSGSITVSGTNATEIGKDASGMGNMIDLTGASFTSTAGLIVGRDGSYNHFRVQNGSVATTGQARIGLNASGDHNAALVTGSGSQWIADGTVRVGSEGSYNLLAVENGATMTVSGSGNNLWIGYGGASHQNRVEVRGSSSVLDVTGAGSEIVISGSTTGEGNWLVLANSGSATVNSVQIGPGGGLFFGDDPMTNPSTAGSITSTATINGNLGPNPNAGGGAVFFASTADFELPNVLSGPLAVVAYNASGVKTTLTAANTYTGPTVVYFGTVALGPSASIANSTAVMLFTPQSVFDASAVTGGFELVAGQTLLGYGTVVGPTTVAAGAIVHPGDEGQVGTLTVTGGFTLKGELVIDLDGATADLLDGSSDSVVLDPTSTITFNPLSAPAGDLVFLEYLSLAGTFGSVVGLPSGYTLDYNYLGGNQIALVAPVPEIDPASAGSVLAMLGGLVGLLERRTRRRG